MWRVRGVLTAGALAILLTACAADPPGAVVGISVTGCPPDTAHGTGVVIEPGLVLASAHVLKGARDIAVETAAGSTTGEIVAFDPEMDLALIRLPSASPPQIDLAVDARRRLDRGQAGQAYVFRDGSVQVIDVRVMRPITIRTEDIYIEGETMRPGFELEAVIQAGDSGGPVVINGEVVAVVWARSNQAERRAYAIDPVAAGALIRQQLATGSIDPSIDLTRCH
jgi:S1-C subfamily serine protease